MNFACNMCYQLPWHHWSFMLMGLPNLALWGIWHLAV